MVSPTLEASVRANRLVTIAGGSELYFGAGQFDDWCIFIKYGDRYEAPTDEWYFNKLAKWANVKSPQDIYDDFVKIYDKTTQTVAQEVFDDIRGIADSYKNPAETELVFAILYMGMIAEENKEHTVLGKRIKRLGVYQTLMEQVHPRISANYSRGKRADYLQEVCKFRGF